MVAILVAGCAVIAVAGLWLSLNYDEGVYSQTERLVVAGQPLVSQVFSSQPPLFVATVLPGWLLGGVVGARVMMLAWGVVALVATYRIGRGLAGRGVAAGATVLVAASPAFLGVTSRMQAEIPSLALALVSLALLVPRAGGARVRGWAVAVSGALFGAALMTKLLVAPMVVPAVLLLLVAAGPVRRRVRSLVLWAGVAAVVVVGVAVPFWHGGRLYEQVVGFHVTAQDTTAGLAANLAVFRYEKVTALVLAGGVGAAMWLAGTGWRRKVSPPGPSPLAGVVLAAWVIATVGFLVIHVPLFDHHLVLAVVPAALAVAVVVARLPVRAAVPLAVVAALGLLAVSGQMVTTSQTLSTQSADRSIAKLRELPAGSTVITDNQVLATLAGVSVPGQLVDTSLVRIASGSLTSKQVCRRIGQVDAVLLTAHGRFGQLPGVARCTRAALRLVWSHHGDRLYRRHR